jgi:hypothetical protein
MPPNHIFLFIKKNNIVLLCKHQQSSGLSFGDCYSFECKGFHFEHLIIG